MNARKMRGSKTGAHILVAAPERTQTTPPDEISAIARQLIVGEGIETALSVWTAFEDAGRDLTATAFWAGGDLGNLAGRAVKLVAHPSAKRADGKPQRMPGPEPDPDDAGLAIPDSVEELILLGDGDSRS